MTNYHQHHQKSKAATTTFASRSASSWFLFLLGSWMVMTGTSVVPSLWSCCFVNAFVVSSFLGVSTSRDYNVKTVPTMKLFGINEWRQMGATKNNNIGSQTTPDITLQQQQQQQNNRTLFLLPFPIQDVLVLGQSTKLTHLKEGRFFDLLDEAAEDHCSVVGIVYMGEDGLLPVLSLCEITTYEIKAGYRGRVTATMTLKCVGRARLQQLIQMKPKNMMGTIHRNEEIVDEDCSMDSIAVQRAENIVGELEEIIKGYSFLDDSNTTTTTTAFYQQNFWLSLSVVDNLYKTAIVPSNEGAKPRDDIHNGLEAASWGILSVLSLLLSSSSSNAAAIYQAMAMTSVVDRLEWAQRLLSEMKKNDEDDNKDNPSDDSTDTMFVNNYDSGFE